LLKKSVILKHEESKINLNEIHQRLQKSNSMRMQHLTEKQKVMQESTS
jgi:hypothetical protein